MSAAGEGVPGGRCRDKRHKADNDEGSSAASSAALVTTASAASSTSLTELPKVVVEAILERADAEDLARIDCAARVFHCGMVETVLRRLAKRAKGKEVPQGEPPTDVVAPRTWKQRLLRELRRGWWKFPGGGPKVDKVIGECRGQFFLKEDGSVYSKGDNRYGQLGHGNTDEQSVFKRIEALSGARVCAVSIKFRHTLFLTEHGEVYSCGEGNCGKLGHGDLENQFVPICIGALSGVQVRAVSAGCEHSLFLTKDGEVWACGFGPHCAFGDARPLYQRVPRRIEALDGIRICAVSAGGCHNLFLTEDGEVYSAGQGLYGQLGHGRLTMSLLDTSGCLNVPHRIEAFGGLRVCAVFAGFGTSLFLMEDGAVYSCGRGSANLLGHGNATDQYVPKRIETFHPTGPRICAIKVVDAAVYFTTDSQEKWWTGRHAGEVATTPQLLAAPAPPTAP